MNKVKRGGKDISVYSLVVLSLEEAELFLYAIAGFDDGKLDWLTRLVRTLKLEAKPGSNWTRIRTPKPPAGGCNLSTDLGAPPLAPRSNSLPSTADATQYPRV